jgi:hypothetical protein
LVQQGEESIFEKNSRLSSALSVQTASSCIKPTSTGHGVRNACLVLQINKHYKEKIMKLVQTSFVAAMALVSLSATAATQHNYCKTEAIQEEHCKNIPSNRREELGKHVAGGNPVAITNENGNLKVWYTVSGSKLQQCQITSNVKSFKMSQNPNDLSTVYFVKDNGDLFDAKMTGAVSAESCPKASTQNYSATMGLTTSDNVVEYKLASNAKSPYTMAARTTSHTVIYSTDTRILRAGPYYTAKQADAVMDQLLGN